MERHPLTEAQEGLWYAQALDRANPVFNCGQYVDLLGPLDVTRFVEAHAAAVAQCPALRLRFALRDGRPCQWLVPEPPALEVVDLTGWADPEAEARTRMTTDSGRASDLECEAPAYFALYLLGPERALWYERIHHLATDGFGIVLFTNRVGEIYSALTDGKPLPTPLAPIEATLAEDATYRCATQRVEDAVFWQEELRGLEKVAGPSAGRTVTAHRFDRTTLRLAPALCALVRARAKAAGVSWPDALTSLTAAYLSRVSDEGERVFGLPFMARLGTRAARVSCMWMNVLPFRHDPDEDAPLGAVLADSAAQLARLRRHGRYRSEQVRRDLQRGGLDGRLYGPVINVQPFDMPPRFAGLEAHLHILGAGAVDDLTVTFRGDAVGALTLEIDSNPRLYTASEGAAHADRLAAFLEAALEAERLADVPTVTPPERQWLVHGLNATAHVVPDTTLTARIEARLQEAPERPAVIFGDRVLNYGELDRRSAALAAALHARGAGPGRVVAVALPRSEHLAVALVAVLRTGAAYMPLDPEAPAARRAELLDRAGAVALLAEAELGGGDAVPFVPGDWPEEGRAPVTAAAPGNPAYLLFTSGSTGAPKGVVIPHRAIVNRLEWMRERYGFGPQDRILQKTPATFDVSVWELFLPCLCGGTLVLAPPGAHRDPAAIAGLVRRHGITAMHFVPSMLAAFLEAPASEGLALKRVFSSGEALSAALRDRFHRRMRAELHNLYGPTEAAVDVSYHDAGPRDESDPLPIGAPVWNTRLHVLDTRMRPVPPGVAGELFIGGVQLAEGYLGQPELTAQRFLPDPFHEGGRLYATGDRAMRRADGALLYLGRADDQVKVRGIRVEPGETEAAIRATGLVRDTVVTARADGSGAPRLVGYVLAEEEFDPATLRAALAARLPEALVPSVLVRLDAWPLTVSGKLDRKALPAPAFGTTGEAPPQGATETGLAELYREVLGLPALPGREADFFDLGGDSLSALTLNLRIGTRMGHDPGLGQVFETPVLSALARAIRMSGEARAGLAPMLPLVPKGEGAPLFILHPAGGLGWGYRRLARALDPHRPVWAVQAPVLGGAALPQTLRGMAEAHAARIAAQRPRGTIHLAGWSVGGILAQEIAVTLRTQGRRVGLVALLDAYPAECWRAEPEPDPVAALRALLAIAGHDPEAHPELDTRAAVVTFLRQGGTPLGSLPEPVLDAVVRLVTGTNRLIREHRHRHYPGTLTHIRAARDHERRDFTAARWQPHATRIDALDVPALHPEMISPRVAELLGPELSARMAAFETPAETLRQDHG